MNFDANLAGMGYQKLAVGSGALDSASSYFQKSVLQPFRSYNELLVDDGTYAGQQRAGCTGDEDLAWARAVATDSYRHLPGLAGACDEPRSSESVPVFVMLPLDTVSTWRECA